VVFNRVPSVGEAFQAIAEIEASVLPRVATLLVKYGLQRRFNITLAHRHFSLLSDTEKVVELQSPSGWHVSSVFKNGSPDPTIVRRYNLDIPKSPSIAPHTFLVDDDRLLPYEFSCVDKEDAERMHTNCVLDREFLASWTRVLAEHHVERRLGLTFKAPLVAQKRQWFNPRLRVDVTLSSPQQNLQFLSPQDIATEWKVDGNSHGSQPIIRRLGYCVDTGICIYCGYPTSEGVCERCGASRRTAAPPSLSPESNSSYSPGKVIAKI
jgi:hypothetical protein